MTRSNIPPNIRRCAMWCHFINLSWIPISVVISVIVFRQFYGGYSALLGIILSPFVAWIFARILCLIFWQMNRHSHPFINESGKAALNFSLSIDLYLLIVGSISFASCGFFDMNPIISVISYLWILIPLLFFGHFCLTIFGGIKAAMGIMYKYPGTIGFIK